MKYCTALVVALAACAQVARSAEPAKAAENQRSSQAEARRLSLVYINDVHAQIEPHPELFWSNGREEFVRDAGGISRIASVFNRLRAERPGELLFIDGGDTIQGSGPAAWTEGRVVVEPMDALGLDVAIPGNWSVAYGANSWKQRAGEFNYPIIAANMLDEETGKLLFEPYLIEEINGARIGIIGFTEPDIPTRQPPYMSEGLAFHADGVLAPLVAELREKHQVDIVVVATHIGLPKAIDLADTLDGVDVILSADTHERTYEPIIRGDTWVVEAGAFASFVGVLDMTVNDEGEIIDRARRLIELRPELFPEDPEVKRIVDEALAPHRRRMNRVLGHTNVWLARYEVLNTSMDTVIVNAIRDATGADIALSNGFRFAPPTAPGPITEADLWTWLPLRLELKRGEATGAQLRGYWRRELENVLSNDSDRLFGGWLPRVAGMTVNFKMHAPAGERLGEIMVGDQPLDENQTYTVAAGHRMGSPDDYVHRVQGCRFINLLDITTHEAVERYLRLHSPIRSEGPLRLRCVDDPGVLRSQFLHHVEKRSPQQ
jgi:2',3'-cyclic-nucleotide 2'-phosphodiesterase (5'-nucleotidase family)